MFYLKYKKKLFHGLNIVLYSTCKKKKHLKLKSVIIPVDKYYIQYNASI